MGSGGDAETLPVGTVPPAIATAADPLAGGLLYPDRLRTGRGSGGGAPPNATGGRSSSGAAAKGEGFALKGTAGAVSPEDAAGQAEADGAAPSAGACAGSRCWAMASSSAC